MQKVEDMQEYRDLQDLKKRMKKLPKDAEERVIQNILNQICWHGPVDRKWLQSEIESQEIVEEMFGKPVKDHPIEDIFGSEIQTGDKWFQDGAGRIVLEENAEDYLIEVAQVKFFRGIE